MKTGLMTRMTALAAVAAPSSGLDPEIDEELRELEAVSRGLEGHTLAPATRRAYAQAWSSFSEFCARCGLQPLPAHPESVRWFVAWMSLQQDAHGLPRFSVATIRQRLAGIADRHLRDGLLDPTGHRAVTDLVRGLAKLRATRPRRKRPLLLDDVRRIVGAMQHDVFPEGISAARDELAIWLGFAGALRRSEAAGLTMDRLELHPRDGVHVRVGKSKADQDNSLPDRVVLPRSEFAVSCPVCAVHRWVALVATCSESDTRDRRRRRMKIVLDHGLEEHVCGVDGAPLISSAELRQGGPLLRATYRNRRSATISADGVSGDALHAMLLTRMAEAGMDPTEYGFHSLRAGHVTQARRNGATTEEVMRAGRWRRAETVDVYDREHDPAARNSVMRLGL